MGWFLLIGLFCLLAVIGFFFTDRPFAFAFGGIVFLIALAFVIIVGFVIYEISQSSSAHTTQQQTPVSQYPSTLVQTTEAPPASSGVASQNEKCVIEDKDLKICDLSYSDSYFNSGYRNIFVEGNAVACVDMKTGEVSQNDVGNLRASTDPSFCATDFGQVYIDPSLEVTKYYGGIAQEDYNHPYKLPESYDTCIWTYNDGSGNIPYLDVLSNVGPRTGYNVKAFCANGNSEIDIYSQAGY